MSSDEGSDETVAQEGETPPERPPEDDGEGRTRRRVSLFLAAFLLYQLVTPLTYYLRDDPYDERFAWRMFSAIRMHSCRTTVTETVESEVGRRVRPINLTQVVHQAWIGTLGRNRRDVIHAFLERRCEEEDVSEVRLVNSCTADDGSPLSPQEYVRDCQTGELTEPDELIVPQGGDEAPSEGDGEEGS